MSNVRRINILVEYATGKLLNPDGSEITRPADGIAIYDAEDVILCAEMVSRTLEDNGEWSLAPVSVPESDYALCAHGQDDSSVLFCASGDAVNARNQWHDGATADFSRGQLSFAFEASGEAFAAAAENSAGYITISSETGGLHRVLTRFDFTPLPDPCSGAAAPSDDAPAEAPPELTAVVRSIASRNALTPRGVGDRVYVLDASGDITVGSGAAEYLYLSDGWRKLSESESMDVTVHWRDIAERPEFFPPEPHSHAPATWQNPGFLSAADKQKLDTVGAGAEPNPANLTLAGNVFNGPGQLLQLAQDGRLPALDAGRLYNLPVNPETVNVPSDWEQDDPYMADFIKNKPELFPPEPHQHDIANAAADGFMSSAQVNILQTTEGKAHTHANSRVLDMFSTAGDQLYFNGRLLDDFSRTDGDLSPLLRKRRRVPLHTVPATGFGTNDFKNDDHTVYLLQEGVFAVNLANGFNAVAPTVINNGQIQTYMPDIDLVHLAYYTPYGGTHRIEMDLSAITTGATIDFCFKDVISSLEHAPRNPFFKSGDIEIFIDIAPDAGGLRQIYIEGLPGSAVVISDERCDADGFFHYSLVFTGVGVHVYTYDAATGKMRLFARLSFEYLPDATDSSLFNCTNNQYCCSISAIRISDIARYGDLEEFAAQPNYPAPGEIDITSATAAIQLDRNCHVYTVSTAYPLTIEIPASPLELLPGNAAFELWLTLQNPVAVTLGDNIVWSRSSPGTPPVAPPFNAVGTYRISLVHWGEAGGENALWVAALDSAMPGVAPGENDNSGDGGDGDGDEDDNGGETPEPAAPLAQDYVGALTVSGAGPNSVGGDPNGVYNCVSGMTVGVSRRWSFANAAGSTFVLKHESNFWQIILDPDDPTMLYRTVAQGQESTPDGVWQSNNAAYGAPPVVAAANAQEI